MTMVVQHSQPDSLFLSLPSELIEHTLVCTSLLGFPEAIATAAQTCRDMRTLVYGATDQHLWREIFLGVFDDPRPGFHIDIQDLRPHITVPRRSFEEIDFDWGAEFRQRIWAANYIRRSTGGSLIIPPTDSIETMTSNLNALEALLSVIHTAAPFPSHILPPPVSSDTSADSYITSKSYPIFPPAPTVYTSTRTNNYRPSRNIEWLQSVLANGLPPFLNMRLSGVDQFGGPQALWATQIESRMMRALGRLTALTGFRAYRNCDEKDTGTATEEPQPDADAEGEAEGETEADVENREGDEEENGEDENEEEENEEADTEVNDPDPEHETREESVQTDAGPVIPLDMSSSAQDTRARRIARMRVYNMRYLSRERHWGPFLLPPSSERSSLSRSMPVEELLDPIFALFAEHDAGHPNLINAADADEEEDEGPVQAPPADTPEPPPGPDKLKADWSYLGAVRIVVETNLRESVGDELNGLLWLDGLRRGSAPMGSINDDDSFPMTRNDKGKGKVKHSDEVEGWDWAGVDGIWRRCVCWMDYRDLILHNNIQLSNGFNDTTLAEAVRIVPMRLRVSHYTPSELPEWTHRPTIHLLGETAGPAGTSGIRRIRGSVQMISDGNIRWTLYSSAVEDGPDEWVTEGVQVGDVTSVMGILGMWTGAQHERMDPLGPFWAWKVG